eukprot:TRINITY_DN22865_c0_g1_i1.p1 TRINITY_DN22865_c0_g1~~TRINITY_DN22865_c0_g1_i1.p1  ORF type:complete len:905 (-),score=151.06 TRINITY_DN22865_c0_g1_i1:636-3305(-)
MTLCTGVTQLPLQEASWNYPFVTSIAVSARLSGGASHSRLIGQSCVSPRAALQGADLSLPSGSGGLFAQPGKQRPATWYRRPAGNPGQLQQLAAGSWWEQLRFFVEQLQGESLDVAANPGMPAGEVADTAVAPLVRFESAAELEYPSLSPPASLLIENVKTSLLTSKETLEGETLLQASLASTISEDASASPLPETPSASSQLTITAGSTSPLGPSLSVDVPGAVNFALFSQHGTAVTLCLYRHGDKSKPPSDEIPLSPEKHRTGDVWHACVKGVPLSGVLYAYKVDGPGGWGAGHRFDPSAYLLDPYAPLVEGRRLYGDASEKLAPFLGTFALDEEPFDWGKELDLKRPIVEEKDVLVYEMGVRAFTAAGSSEVKEELRGSYLGLVEKIPHLQELGVTAVELLPIFEFDEFEFQRRPNDRDHMVNTWGYSTLNFFSPMSRYASNGAGPAAAAREVKQMVKALHAAGIEVWLDVVYNHTNEADDAHPYLTSFRGIDNLVYYIVDTNNYVQLSNYSGCGNTFNCNHPVVMELVLDSLRHWVTEYHIDGFRFDLASALCRGTDGAPLSSPPLIRAIAKDEVLQRAKIIAEPWDCGGLYLVGRFPNWDRWAEWNGMYRDDVRRFIKGDEGMKSAFATRLSGSADLYNVNKRKPYHSVNFVIAHDGFTLMDMVSYNEKHNEANGEGGQDGSNDNLSWNCGVEGPTGDQGINALRLRQMKNFHVALMVSQGTPMMVMGDEYGHTRGGNNNSYGFDTDMNHFQWQQLADRRDDLFRFFSNMNHFRRSHPLLGRESFLTDGDVTWHEDNWLNPESRFLAFTLHDRGQGGGSLYTAFNAHSYAVAAGLPTPPSGTSWHRLVDTNLPAPADFEGGETRIDGNYLVAPFSALVLVAKQL